MYVHLFFSVTLIGLSGLPSPCSEAFITSAEISLSMNLPLLVVNFQIRVFHEPYINFISLVAVLTKNYQVPDNGGIQVHASLMHNLQNVFQGWPLSLSPKCWGGRKFVRALGRKRTFAGQLILEKVIFRVQ